MSVNTKLTNLANEIREISGTTTKKSLDVMASDIGAANDLIDEQETLLNDLRDIVDTLPEPISGVEYHLDDDGHDGLSIDRSFSYIDIKQENEIYTNDDCVIIPSGDLRLNEADGTTDLYVNTLFNDIVISADNRVEIRDINCSLNFDGANYVVVNAEDGMDTDFEINGVFNHMEFNADNRISVYDSELIIASDGSGSLQLENFSGQVSARTLIAENIKSGVNILGVIGTHEGGGSGSGGSAELTIKINSNLSISDRCFYTIYFRCAAPEANGAEMSGYATVDTDFDVMFPFEETFSVKPNSMFAIIMEANEEWGSKIDISTTYTINGTHYPDNYVYNDYSYFNSSITPSANSSGVFTINITKN